MALTTEEQRFYDFAKGALPDWIPDGDEFLMGAAKMFGGVKALIDYLFGQALIGTAIGQTATTPDWLGLHARDRGTARQDGETTPALRERLRTSPDALTRVVLLSSVNSILEADGITADAQMVELPRDAAHCGKFAADADATSGGSFTAGAGTLKIFTPSVPFSYPPFRDPTVIRLIQGFKITISNAAAPANNGTFTIVGLSGNGAIYDNAAGVTGADPGADWSVEKLDRNGQARNTFGRSFCRRGYRAARSRPVFVIMLPFGATEATAASVREMLRTKKAAGIAAIVERRLNP